MGREAGLVPARMARGSRCFGAWLGHELVGYGWLSSKPEWIGEIELEIAPIEGEAYIWNCVTLDPHRRKGVFRSIVTSLVAQGREEGLTRLWIASVSGLAESAMEQAGFVRAVRFGSTTRFGLRWLTVAPAPAVEDALLSAALKVTATKAGSSMRRSRSRVH